MRAILTYHSIDNSKSPISVSPEVFEEHVRWMSESNVDVVTLDDLLSSDAPDSSHAIAITFDDGFANFMQAADLMARHDLPVTLFVVSGHVGGTNRWGGRTEAGIPVMPLLGWEELEQLTTRGVTIGAHTRTHTRLTTLSPAGVEDEMDGCLQELHARLRVRAAHFAYPYGAVDDHVAAAASRRFGISVTTEFRPLKNQESRVRLPRLDMYYFRELGAIRMWGSPRFDRRLWTVRTRRRVREALA